jgi:large subunit ribosomal protein L1
MAKRGKRYIDIRGRVDPLKRYALAAGFALARELATAKFDESVDVAIRLGVDPRQADQMVRGAVLLPHGTGKTARVIAFAKGEKEKEARDAGADEVGAEDLAQRITDGWLEFDKAVATPDLMGVVGKLGRILGPRGLMPNPKVGTVTFDIGKAVSELKAGKVEFRVEKAGIIHVPLGRASFSVDQLEENARALIDVLNRLKPSSSKGVYMRSMTVSTTMGPGIDIDLATLKD